MKSVKLLVAAGAVAVALLVVPAAPAQANCATAYQGGSWATECDLHHVAVCDNDPDGHLTYARLWNWYTGHYYLSGYDPDLEKLSIGNILVAHAIEQAVRDGATTFDFLRGAEEYKYRWGSQDQPLYHVAVRAPGPRGLLASLLRVRLRWWLRRYPLMKRLHAACTS